MRVKVVSIMIGAFETISKKELEELEISLRIESIQTTASLRSEESQRPEETCYHSDSSERSPPDADVKNSQGIIIYRKSYRI